MTFYTHERVECPNCPKKVVGPEGRKLVQGVALECTVTNYSGCSVDFGECPECGKRFQVSYKVDEVIEV